MTLERNFLQKITLLVLTILCLLGNKIAIATPVVIGDTTLFSNDSLSIIQQISEDTIVYESNVTEVYRIIKEANLLPNYQTIDEALDLDGQSFMQQLNKDIATRFAPVHHQEIDKDGAHALNGKSDYITKINFDGDWVMTNNWENTNTLNNDPSTFTATVYYSVIWTRSHWYISYFFFHPRDWSNTFCIDEHENDGEGVLLIVPQTDINKAQVVAMVTLFHKDFYAFNRSGQNKQVPFSGNRENIDGQITFEGQHPRTAQEAKGHGILNLEHNSESIRPGLFGGIKFNQDGRVVYRPIKNDKVLPEWPASINDKDVKYELVSVFESNGLWDHRNDPTTFIGNTFKGDKEGNSCMRKNAANPPWNWKDKNDGLIAGTIATDPAYLAVSYFSNTGFLDIEYLYNPYPQALPLVLPVENDSLHDELVNRDTIKETILTDFDLVVYPNPTTDYITIEIPTTRTIQEIRVIDMLGRSVYHQIITDRNQVLVDLTSYKNGLYYVEWITNGRAITKKVLKKNIR